MLNFKKRRNSTSLDEIGLKLSLTRGVNESLEDFNRRVFKASNIKVDKESFYKSLGFVTPKQDIDFLKIEKVSVDDEVLITITDSHFQVEYVDEIIYRRKLKDIKK